MPDLLNRPLTLLFLWVLVLPLQAASDRPSGVPGEAKLAKVDRVVDGDTVYTKTEQRSDFTGLIHQSVISPTVSKQLVP